LRETFIGLCQKIKCTAGAAILCPGKAPGSANTCGIQGFRQRSRGAKMASLMYMLFSDGASDQEGKPMRKTEKQLLDLHVNGETYILTIGNETGEVSAADTLVHTLRENLSLTGTKICCDKGACGACAVIVDGEAVPSCTLLTVECEGKEIVTIEGLMDMKTGALDPLQQAFIDNAAYQCGFCSPGAIIVVKALLNKNPKPAMTEIQEALAGNFCRCGTHHQVVETVLKFTGQEAN
jgi:carbon-monoxide dehydrogenase small subunit